MEYQAFKELPLQHDLHLVVVSVMICLLASYTAYSLTGRSLHAALRPAMLWLAAAAVASGAGIWANHFIAMLAYLTPVPVGYEEAPTLLSIVVAILISGIGLAIATPRLVGMPLLGGAMIGAGIGAMHYIGMSAWHLQGVIEYDPAMVMASLVIGIGLASAATAIGLARSDALHRLIGAALLTLGICAMHFVAIAAMTIRLDPSVAIPGNAVSSIALGVSVSVVSVLILCLALGGALVNQRDVARKLREARHLRANEARFRQLANATFEGILIESGGRIIDANVVISDLIGVPIAELIGRRLTECFAASSRADVLNDMSLNAAVPREVVLLAADGTPIQAEILTRTVPPSTTSTSTTSNGTSPQVTSSRDTPSGDISSGDMPAGDAPRVLAVRDIRARQRAEEHLRHMALHDALTGLPNRRMFVDRLHQELARSKRDGTTVAVLCLDLDRFKEVNDLAGHRAGDALLMQVVRRLADSVRDEDTVSRFSGDEFAVVQVGVKHPGGPGILAERLVREIARPFDLCGQQITIGTSVGIALYPADGSDAEELLRAADTALRRAKEAGKGTFRFFEAEMDLRLQERRALGRDLRHAVANDELRVHYQPLVDCRSGRVLGFEALLRWYHPVQGSIPPSHFIPLAEECGLILPLGAWVMRRACADAAAWPADKMVAVNLSPAQFRQADPVLEILTVLRETGLPADRLEIEITEGLLMDDSARTLDTLLALKTAGIRISLDDFGTGYSSLSYLQRFPFDKIKIDRSFVSQMEQNPDSMSIVRAVIALGKALRIKIVAEGVETAAQLDLLQQEDCDLVQGYLLGRPASQEKLGWLLLANSHAPQQPRQAA